LDEFVEYWERRGGDIQREVWVLESGLKDGLVQVLWVEAGDVLRSHVEESVELVEVASTVGLEELEGSIGVWVRISVGLLVSVLIDLVVEIFEGHISCFDVLDVKSGCCIWKVAHEFIHLNI